MKKKVSLSRKKRITRHTSTKITIHCDECPNEDDLCAKCQAIVTEMYLATIKAVSIFPGERLDEVTED